MAMRLVELKREEADSLVSWYSIFKSNLSILNGLLFQRSASYLHMAVGRIQFDFEHVGASPPSAKEPSNTGCFD